jgi:hypothetical protein
MKKKMFKAAWGGFLSLLLLFESASAFDGPTHGYITDKSVEYFSMMHHDLFDFNENEKKILHDYSLQPDTDENEGGFKNHFYNYATESNYAGDKISALSRFKTHYKRAIEFYEKYYQCCQNELLDKSKQQNYLKKALQELGRSLHFLEDLNTPVHTVYETSADAVIKFPMHIDFENKANILCKTIECDFSKEYFEKYKQSSLNSIGKSSALLAADNFLAYSENRIPQEEAIYDAVVNGLKNVTGLIIKFFSEIKNEMSC